MPMLNRMKKVPHTDLGRMQFNGNHERTTTCSVLHIVSLFYR
jgi:hypothetical protein